MTVPDVAGTMMLVFSCFGFVAAGVILFTSSSPGPIFYVAMSAGLFFGVTGIIAKRYAASVNKKSKKEPSYKEYDCPQHKPSNITTCLSAFPFSARIGFHPLYPVQLPY